MPVHKIYTHLQKSFYFDTLSLSLSLCCSLTVITLALCVSPSSFFSLPLSISLPHSFSIILHSSLPFCLSSSLHISCPPSHYTLPPTLPISSTPPPSFSNNYYFNPLCCIFKYRPLMKVTVNLTNVTNIIHI